MRMWNVNPKLLCKDHLNGEHLEIHKFIGALRAGRSVKGYLEGLYAVHLIRERHEQLVEEMLRRGWKHKSPIPPDFDELECVAGWVHGPEYNLAELAYRCAGCRKRQGDLL